MILNPTCRWQVVRSRAEGGFFGARRQLVSRPNARRSWRELRTFQPIPSKDSSGSDSAINPVTTTAHDRRRNVAAVHVRFRETTNFRRAAEMVKVFGCRPSLVAGLDVGRRTETAQVRTRGDERDVMGI